MQNHAEYDSYQQYPYDKNQIPTFTRQYKKIIRKQPQQYPLSRLIKEVEIEDSHTEFYYSTSNETKQTNDQNNSENRAQSQIGLEQPTLPYYVVPVLYVPTRVLPNESTLPLNSCRGRGYAQSVPQRSRQPLSMVGQKRYSRKTYDDNYYQEYYTSVENADTDNEEQGVDDHSYYNMEYTISTSTVKEEVTPMYTQEQYVTADTDTSYNYLLENTQEIRPLKSHTHFPQYAEYNHAANLRHRCSFANLQQTRTYNEALPQTSKAIHYVEKTNYEVAKRAHTQDPYGHQETMQLVAGDCFPQNSNFNDVSKQQVRDRDTNHPPCFSKSNESTVNISPYIIGDCVPATCYNTSINEPKDAFFDEAAHKTYSDISVSVKFVDCGTGSSEYINVQKPKVFVDSSAMTVAVICKSVEKLENKVTQTAEKSMNSISAQTENDISAIFSDIIHDTLVPPTDSQLVREARRKSFVKIDENRVLRKLSLIKQSDPSAKLNSLTDMRSSPVMNKMRIPMKIKKIGDIDISRKYENVAQEPTKRVSSTVVNIITSIQKLSRIVQDMQPESKTRKKQSTCYASTNIPGPSRPKNITSELLSGKKK